MSPSSSVSPTPNAREEGYLVFSQSGGAVDIDAWNQHASRFFAARLGFASAAPEDLSFVVAPDGATPGVRAAHARNTVPEDHALAEAAEGGRGGGLALLAKRCGTVWLVERQDPADILALRLAAILASVLLGPIVDPAIPEIFGVKTAREKIRGYTTRS
ncbi:MAG TPA: hypothetical protein VGM06_22215 [Polyangiaceae bacterium]|jgi:hypothetical protein